MKHKTQIHKNISRRNFLAKSTILTATATLAPTTTLAKSLTNNLFPQDQTFFTIKKLKPNLVAVYEGGGNAVILLDQKSNTAILSDTKLPHLGYTLHRELQNAGYHIAKYINTHHHLDHTGGNYAFNNNLPHIAHHNLTPRVRAQLDQAKQRALGSINSLQGDTFAQDITQLKNNTPNFTAQDFIPNIEMKQNENDMEVSLGSETLTLHYLEPAHTDNDIYLHFPKYNVIHTGDLLFHNLNPFIDARAGANTRGWQRCLQPLIKKCNAQTIVVPGHGEITDITGLKKMDTYFTNLRKIVADARKQGKSKEEITQLKPEIFANLGFKQILPMNLAIVFDELEKEG